MKVLNLQAKMRQKRKYSSHKGDVGKKAENLIQRQFEGSKTMEKCYTDVTELPFQQVLKSFTYHLF